MSRVQQILMISLYLVSLLCPAYSMHPDREPSSLYEENRAYKQQLYESINVFIDQNPDFYQLDELYFRLAELSAELYVTEPERTLSYYRKVLEINPEHPLQDVILYNIGYYSFDHQKRVRDQKRSEYIQGMIEAGDSKPVIQWGEGYKLTEESLHEAIYAFRKILTEIPDSKYYSESLYRLSVLYYEIGLDADEPVLYYQQARRLLDLIAEREDDEYHALGLYYRGWANFSTNSFPEAIADFANILNIIAGDEVLSSYFEMDAMDNIAFSLERMDGSDYTSPSNSVHFARERLPILVDNEEHQQKIIQKTIQLKLDMNAPFHAIDYYNGFLEMFPLHIDNPLYVDSVATLYQRYSYMMIDQNEMRQRVVEQKEKIIERFPVNSSWYQHNKDYDISEQLEVIRSAYEFLEPRYLNRFVNEKSDSSFQTYYDLVTSYEEYPEFRDDRGQGWIRAKSKYIVDAILEIAELREEPNYYLKSYDRITDYNELYPDNEEHFEYEVKKFLIVETLFDMLYNDLDEDPYLDDESGITLTRHELETLFLDNSSTFLQLISLKPEDDTIEEDKMEEYNDDVIRALYKRSQIFSQREMYEEAENELLQILEYNISDQMKRTVLISLAGTNETISNFELSEKYYREASEYAIDEEDSENIKNHYRAQMQTQASRYVANSLYVQGAEEYIRLADEYRTTDLDRFVGFTREAIDSYIMAEEYQSAIDLLIELSDYRSEPQQSYYLYVTAWDIADSLLHNQDMNLKLKEEFIDKHPESNQAYLTRYEIIDDYANNPETKILAGDMLLELHNDAISGRIDYGADETADIFFDALELYQEHPDKEFLISKMLEFTEKYPYDNRTIGVLELVAYQYSDMGKEDDFEHLARIIYLRNPESELYDNIARKKILEQYDLITELFLSEQYDEMFMQIDQFRELDKEFQQDNLKLPLEEFYLDFADYEYTTNRILAHRSLIVDLQNKLTEIENDYINATPGELLRVNQHTRWQENLVAGDNRLQRTVERVNVYRDTIVDMLQQARDFEQGIDVGLNTRAVYIIAKAFDHTANVMDIQLDRFIEVSNQLIELRNADQEEYHNIVRFIYESYKGPYLEYLITESVDWYNLLVVNFDYRLNHRDQYTEMAKTRLEELGQLPLKISVYTDTEWLATSSENSVNIAELFVDYHNAAWGDVAYVSDKEGLKRVVDMNDTKAEPIWITASEIQDMQTDSLFVEDYQSDKTAFFLKRFDLEGEVLEARMSYASSGTGSIWLNGHSIFSDSDVRNSPDDSYYVRSLNVRPDFFAHGDNMIIISSDFSSDKQAIILDLNLIISNN